jgi:two-component system nitrate/nitrite response regulator NarL
MELENEKIRVLIADDHGMILDILSLYLSAQTDIFVKTAADVDTAADLLKTDGSYDVILLDYNMPGMHGLKGLDRIMRANESKPVAILTGNPTRRMMDEALEMGAAGILPKTMPAKSLANAIRFIHAGETYMPLSLMRDELNAPSANGGPLSAREMTVLAFLGEGKQNKEIANELDLSEATIKMHVKSICKKLDANNRTHAVINARDMGLL